MLDAVDGLRRWSGGVGLTRRQAAAAVVDLGRTLRDVFLGDKGRRLLADLDRTALLLMVDETVLHLPWEMMFDTDNAPLRAGAVRSRRDDAGRRRRLDVTWRRRTRRCGSSRSRTQPRTWPPASA